VENNPQAFGFILDPLLEALQRNKGAESAAVPALNPAARHINLI
jgi:hypothetical protein